jgi:hypothetical protein
MSTEAYPSNETEKDIRGDDPPIIVGGGGSAYVWIRKDLNPTLVADPSTIRNHPKSPNKYHVFNCGVDIKNITVDNGKGNQTPVTNVDKDKHLTGFE